MDALTHKYPNCGGPLTLDPRNQKFHYEYCLNIYTEEEVSQYEQKQREVRMAGEGSREEPSSTEDLTFTAQEQLTNMNEAERKAFDGAGGSSNVADEAAGSTVSMDLFLCPSCGAEIVTDATTATTYCYYCHNLVVLSGRLSGEFLSNRILPFAVEKEEAINRFLAWIKKKWFVPKAFFSKGQINKLTDIYFPYWTTDAEVDGTMRADGTVIRIRQIGDIEYTETKQFVVSRASELSFKGLVKNASSENTQRKMIEGVQPFPLDKTVDFRSQYLAGSQAEERDIEYETIRSRIQSELKDYSKKLLEDTADGYIILTDVRTSTSVTNEINNYVLLPVWLVTYQSNNPNKKVYYYTVNGQTGKVSGVLPISQKKLGLTTLGVFAGLAILSLIKGYLI